MLCVVSHSIVRCDIMLISLEPEGYEIGGICIIVAAVQGCYSRLGIQIDWLDDLISVMEIRSRTHKNARLRLTRNRNNTRSIVKARDIGVHHRASRCIRHLRLKVHAVVIGERVLIVCGHCCWS